ncbi:MAG: PAS domain-containing sensor histidine kinase [Cyanobacteria bacterium SID2]|nr:PAS domain-containing sensor histidine kinase [Cyanobacteria bacterium SID2]MBP0005909.1 PAS domain-containing sensor histidine kinase [Cyanobacteria bacterium SBC]
MRDVTGPCVEIGQLAQLSLDRMTDAVLLVDERGSILYGNESLYRLLSVDRDELLACKIWEIEADSNRESWEEYWKALQQQKSICQETVYRTQSGGNLTVKITASYLSAEYSCLVVRPLSEQAAVVQEIRRTREHLRAVLDAVPGFVSWMSQDGRYLGVNRHLAASYNMPPEAFVGKELGFLKNSPEFVEFVRQFLADEDLYASQVIRASVRGIDRYYIIAAQKYDERRATVAVGIDITERKQSEEVSRRSEARLREKTQQLEDALRERQHAQARLIQSEKMYALGQMVAGMAHEINNPINFIYGNLAYADNYVKDLLGLMQLYREQLTDLTPEIDAAIEAIDLDFIASDLPKIIDSMKIGAERILKLVLSLRNFSRLDEAEFKHVNLHEGIDSALVILNHRLQDKIEVTKRYQAQTKIDCYPAQLNQVWMNLLCNAIDAFKDSAVGDESLEFGLNRPKISIATDAVDEERVCVRIRDNGRGIPPQLLEKIFDPFFTTKPVGTGTGLGLSICYQIIETHRGSIHVTSEPDIGTEFSVVLPIKPFDR